MYRFPCVLGVAIAASIAVEASAACRQTFDCTSGQCRPTQLCDSPLDLPAVALPGVPPIVEPSIPPIPDPMVPPIGTTSCQPMRVCDNSGACDWEMACH